MTTEESIVYQLLNTIRAAELTNDEVITERRVRSLLRTHRAAVIWKAHNKGFTAVDEFFQEIALDLTKINQYEWTSPVPSIIRLDHNFGTKFLTKGFGNIPIVKEEEYYLSRTHLINKNLPMAKIEEQILTLRIPEVSPYVQVGTMIAQTAKDCLVRNQEKVVMKVILDDPSEGLNYDWTKSKYPCPIELVQVIKENILRKEFSIILQTKSDQVPNAKNDTLRYHDQGKVQS